MTVQTFTSETPKNPATGYTAVYRVGGTDRFQWRRTENCSKEEADAHVETLQRQGYKAWNQTAKSVDTIGLPATWAASESPDEFEVRADGWTYRKSKTRSEAA